MFTKSNIITPESCTNSMKIFWFIYRKCHNYTKDWLNSDKSINSYTTPGPGTSNQNRHLELWAQLMKINTSKALHFHRHCTVAFYISSLCCCC